MDAKDDPKWREPETHEERLEALGIDELTNRVWCLVFSMAERGITGDDPWWGQDYLGVKQMLEARGLNCDPSAGEAPAKSD